jgi:hypothetical protein
MGFDYRIAGSIIAGWLLAGLLVAISTYLNDAYWSSILLWHWAPVYDLVGRGAPIAGYHNDGSPIYEGTPIHLLFGFVGYFAGFIIYPVAIFLVLTLIDRLKQRNG